MDCYKTVVGYTSFGTRKLFIKVTLQWSMSFLVLHWKTKILRLFRIFSQFRFFNALVSYIYIYQGISKVLLKCFIREDIWFFSTFLSIYPNWNVSTRLKALKPFLLMLMLYHLHIAQDELCRQNFNTFSILILL